MTTRVATMPNPAAMMATTDARSGLPDRKMPPVAPPRSSSAQHPASDGRRGGGGYSIENSRSPLFSPSASTSSPRQNQNQNHQTQNQNQNQNQNQFQNSDAYRVDHGGREEPRSSGRRGGGGSSSGRHQGRDAMSVPVRPHPIGPTAARTDKPSSREVVGEGRRESDRDRTDHHVQPQARVDLNDAAEALGLAMLDERSEDRERDERATRAPAQAQAQAQTHGHTHNHTHTHTDAADLEDAAEAPSVPVEHEGRREGREGRDARLDQGKREKITRFADYDLGNTLGEGEFGKVKLGWKQHDSGNKQYAIKLIKKDTLGDNPSRLAKVSREVNILRRVSHPNIVKLVDTQKDRRYIGIILEYASGGELFDFILSHRSLKENVARRLFAQLISGVGYLHKQGIVHRDLKLENLLLDKNRNIIITDFGFANTFEAAEALTEEEELNLSDKEFVKRLGLDEVRPDGSRKGDLMQTSCGSPCYAAPELVISDSLYTGRKVDVWSCGVILYAMLAGYLPFDDDPANPEGDNINQLYRYIVSTPLTFPEPVGPGARDLLRRILVPNPRKRADLFEVARHSWLSEFADVIELITSATTSSAEIKNSTVPAEDLVDNSYITRSTSVREASRPKIASPVIGGLVSKQGGINPGDETYSKQQKDAKRRTVQVEYVAPQTQTRRGEVSNPPVSGGGSGSGSSKTTRVRSRSREPTDTSRPRHSMTLDKPLPDVPPNSSDSHHRSSRHTRAPGRHGRDSVHGGGGGGGALPPKRSQSDGPSHSAPPPVAQSQPAPPKVAGAVAHGRIHQPGALQPDENQSPRRAAPDAGSLTKSAHMAAAAFEDSQSGSTNTADPKNHRRSITLNDVTTKILGRNLSLFGRRKRPEGGDKSRRYPPTSMTNSMPAENPRQSMDSRMSRRSLSLGFGRRRSGSLSGDKPSRRFSFLPPSVSKAMGISRDMDGMHTDDSNQDLPIQDVQTDDDSRHHARQGRPRRSMAPYDAQREPDRRDASSSSPAVYRRPSRQQGGQKQGSPPAPQPTENVLPISPSESSVEAPRRGDGPESSSSYHRGFESSHERDDHNNRNNGPRNNRVLQKHKRFADAYDGGAARRVMDLFRMSGRKRGG